MEQPQELSPSLLAWLGDQGDEDTVVLLRDPDRHTVYVSDNAEAILGQPTERVREDVYSLVVADDQEAVFRMSRAVRRQGVFSAFQPIALRRADGTVTRCDMTVHNYLDDPDVGGVVVLLRRVRTENTEADLVFSLRSASTDLIVVQDDAAQTRYVSPSVRRLLGLTPEELVEAGASVFHHDDAVVFFEARRSVIDGSPEERLEARLRHRDGTWRTFDAVISNRFDDRTIQGLVITARDITELVAARSELTRTRAQLEGILATSPDVPLLLDDAATITFCGASVTTILGFAPDDLVGHTIADFVHPDDLPETLVRFGNRGARRAGEPNLIIRVRHAAGHHVVIEPIAVGTVDVPGLRGRLVSLRDVTDRIREQRTAALTLGHSSSIALVLSTDGEILATMGDIEPLIGDVGSLAEGIATAMFEADPPLPADVLFQQVIEGGPGATSHVVGRLGPPGGEKRWVDIVTWNATDDPAIGGIISSIRDVDDAVQTAEAQNRLAQVVASTSDLVLLFDPTWNLLWCNDAGGEVVGATSLDSTTVLARTAPRVRKLLVDEIRPALDEHNSWRGELELAARDGSRLVLESTFLAHRSTTGELEYISSISRDVTARRELEAQLSDETRQDPLTGLANRAVLMEHLAQWEHPDAELALALIDIDHLKEINDTQGHELGDRVIEAVADRLRSLVRPGDLVARFSGDEFVVVFDGVMDEAHALALAHDVRAGLRGRIHTADLDLFVTASIGIAVGAGSASDLVAQADAAMYAAKTGGRDQVAPFRPALREQSERRRQTLHDLRDGLDRGEVVAWFQPIVRSGEDTVVMVEALARWHHPRHGLLLPAAFLDVAESAGLTSAVGTAVLDHTLRLLAGPLGACQPGGEPLVASVNLSVHQLADAGFVEEVADAIAAHGVGADRLVFEVTEGETLRDETRARRTLDGLRALGARIALDDFGTGYSSLAYLQQLPVDLLKVDRQFVHGLAPASAASSITQVIVDLGRSLGLDVIAEGVETAAQAEAVWRMGCDLAQGFLHSPAVAADDLADVIARIERGGGPSDG